jgi:hypothetical protein
MKSRTSIIHTLSLFFIILATGYGGSSHAMECVAGVIHLDTSVGGGVLSPEEMINKVKEAGIKVAVITDKDNMRVEYGISPLRKIAKKVKERNSITTYGAEKYLDVIDDISKKYPDMTIIAGVEAQPFYYWEGSYFNNDLRLVNLHKHLLIIGMESPGDFEGLPSVSYNTPAMIDIWCVLNLWPMFLISAGVWLVLRKKKDLVQMRMFSYKKERRSFALSGAVILVAGVVFTINNFPFCSPLYDQYHGDRGAVPYQNLIDYAEKRGGMTFWAHPDVGGSHKLNDIEISTPPYSNELLRTYNYTGFAAFVEGIKFSGRPGGYWDTALKQYISGERQKPVWAIGELDYKEGSWMGNTQTVFIVKKNSRTEILNAMREGRMYAVNGELKPVLEAFQIWDDEHGVWTDMGSTATAATGIRLKIKAYLPEKDMRTATLRVIREGVVIKEISLNSAIDMELNDEFFKPGGRTYYRIDIDGRLISNPIFVTMEKHE